MQPSQDQKNKFKTIGHHLKPIIIIAEKGLTENIKSELTRALTEHELIKIQFRSSLKEERTNLITKICKEQKCFLIQSIGKTALLYKANSKPNQKLSNIQRFKHL